MAVYNASTNAYMATVNLLASSVPTALAVDSTNGFVYVADRSNSRIEYFNAATCNATTQTSCGATPTTVSVGNTPVALTVASSAGDLYVANAGSGGGISVVSLTTHAVVKTISTSQPSNGTGLVQSIGMSPDNQEVLAVLVGLGFPGDVMATINTSTQSISSTVGLENGSDAMGQLVSDGTLGYAWVTDETSTGDLVQNLNLAVSDPAGQPYVTAVGGTSVTALGPTPSEKVWNDALNYSEGAAGGGISQIVLHAGVPAAARHGERQHRHAVRQLERQLPRSPRRVGRRGPEHRLHRLRHPRFRQALTGALWAGRAERRPCGPPSLAVVASANGNTVGYGALNPALYLLAQKSPSTYLNDITSGNNDYNATNSGQFPAMSGYDMASGLGTPVASQLATGLMGIPLAVAVSGSQTYGGSPTFSGSANYAGSGGPPFDVTVNTSGITCTTVGASTLDQPHARRSGATPWRPRRAAGRPSRAPTGGTTPSSTRAPPTTSRSIPSRSMSPCRAPRPTGGYPSFAGTDSPPSGITVSTSGLSCTKVGASTTHRARPWPPAATRCWPPRAAGRPSRAPTPPTTPSPTRVRQTTSP